MRSVCGRSGAGGLPPLPRGKPEEMMPFFIQLKAAQGAPATSAEESEEVIVQNDDGTFRISRLPRRATVDVNAEFKQLVDSVLG